MPSKKSEDTEKGKLLAVVRLRGTINLNHDIKRTFDQLNLKNKNWCVIVKDTDSNKGMIFKVKDYVTWGEISKEVFEEMVKKRGEEFLDREKDTHSKLTYKKYLVFNKKKYKRFFRLSPPRKGYGRNGIKTGFSKGGALGYRKEKINDLLKRMI